MKRIGRWLFGLALLPIAHNALSEVFCADTSVGLQNALIYAASNGEDDEIRVVQGNYIGNFVYSSMEQYALAVGGGWTGGCINRVVDAANTTLIGNQNERVIRVSASDVPITFLLQGVTITNGTKGGLHANVEPNSKVTLEANIFKSNSAEYLGGGVFVESVADLTVTFINNTITDNEVLAGYNGGGGLALNVDYGFLAATFTNNNIIGNEANSNGGGIYIYSDESNIIVNFNGNIIQENISPPDYWNKKKFGGGLYVHSSYGDITAFFTNNNIVDNFSTSDGGGVYLKGGSEWFVIDELIAVFTGNNIEGNIADEGDGGGVFLQHGEYGNVNFTNNKIHGNKATNYGGLSTGGGTRVDLGNGSILFANNSIHGNWVGPGWVGGRGSGAGADVYNGGTSTFINNSFHGNTAKTIMKDSYDPSSGGGLRLTTVTSASLFNNIFWNNDADFGADLVINNDANGDLISSPVTLRGNNFNWSQPSGLSLRVPVVIDNTNPNAVDPFFVDAANGDLRLKPASPMIDAGYPATPGLPLTDLAGGLRVVGGVVDIGAYEYHEYEFCDANQLTLDNEDIGPGGDNYSSEVGISTHGSVNISYDADVVLTAPVIQLNPGLKVESGAQLLLRAQSVTCPLLVMACGVEK